MARYKVDKKKFDEKLLEEQLRSVELQKKYLKDEPLRRSEVDEYNKLQANGWIKNTLISLGVTFATAIAVVVFVLLGNMLFTNGRTGNVGAYNLNSTAIYEDFVKSDDYPENSELNTEIKIIEYKVPSEHLVASGGSSTDIISITYRLSWVQYYDTAGAPKIDGEGVRQGYWEVGRDPKTKSVGFLTQDRNTNNSEYQLDSRTVNLNTLMTNWFKGQEDGWAKTMIEDFFYTAWPLTLVLWLVFILSIAGYAVVLVVGIRYVIRTVISILRRTGYIASDFVTEVVDSVRSEIPIVDEDQAEELDLVAVRKQVQKKLAQDDSSGGLPEYKFEPEDNLEEDVPKKKESLTDSLKEIKEEEDKPVVITSPEPVVEEPKEEKKKESKAQDKIIDIFDL